VVAGVWGDVLTSPFSLLLLPRLLQAVATAATQPQQQQGGSGQVNLQAAVAELMTNVGKQAASSR
jgi:hypothetical protein